MNLIVCLLVVIKSYNLIDLADNLEPYSALANPSSICETFLSGLWHGLEATGMA